MIDAICAEIKLKTELIQNPISTIYLGGGTPSLLSAFELNSIFRSIEKYYLLTENPEITIEVNPDDVDTEFIQMIRDSPINRLSLGIQSFFEADLQYMNRAHNADESRRAIELCLSSGINNITADLIYGTPTLSHKHWRENINTLASFGIPHLSCYQLTVEDKTPLEAFIERGAMKAPADEHAVEQFYILLDEMESRGYEAYEISNYARPGFRSRHNSSYWLGESYLGFGPSAHSYVDNTRSWNTVVNNRYMEEIEIGNIPQTQEKLTPANQYNEFILTRLRTNEGIKFDAIENYFPEFNQHFIKSIEAPLKRNFISKDIHGIVLTREGKVWADAITGELMV